MSKQTQTAFQQFMVKLREKHPELFNEYSQEGREFINTFYPFLELEKEQIENSYKNGRIDQQSIFNFDRKPEQYYTETYGSK